MKARPLAVVASAAAAPLFGYKAAFAAWMTAYHTEPKAADAWRSAFHGWAAAALAAAVLIGVLIWARRR